MKKKFQPNYIIMKNKEGMHVPLTQRAEAIADYLEQDHWTNHPINDMPDESVIFQNVQSDDSEFLIEELDWALNVSTVRRISNLAQIK